MANHKSAIKRIRSSEVKKQRNRYQHKTARTAMKKFFEITKKKEAENQKRIREEEMQLELEKKRMEFNSQNEIYNIELNVKK